MIFRRSRRSKDLDPLHQLWMVQPPLLPTRAPTRASSTRKFAFCLDRLVEATYHRSCSPSLCSASMLSSMSIAPPPCSRATCEQQRRTQPAAAARPEQHGRAQQMECGAPGIRRGRSLGGTADLSLPIACVGLDGKEGGGVQSAMGP